jgi:hypothetical protein
MKLERDVWCEKGAVTKKAVFSPTNIASRKRAFSIDNSANPMKRKQLALIRELFWTGMEPLCRVSRGKTGEADTGKRDYRNPAFPDSPRLSGKIAIY